MSRARPVDPTTFIRENTRLAPVPGLPDVVIHTAQPTSGLYRLAEESGMEAPYWAYAWGGGVALARYLRDHPELAHGRHILDMGAGSGLVGITAAKLGAAKVMAADSDRFALAAVPLNAAANGVTIETIPGDLMTAATLPFADFVLVGDVFYSRDLADRMLAFLRRCRADGMMVLIGDPGRGDLPRADLNRIAEYSVPDVGDLKGMPMKPTGIFSVIG